MAPQSSTNQQQATTLQINAKNLKNVKNAKSAVRVAAASVNQLPLDFSGNVARLSAVISEARNNKVSVLCCPELSLSGYGCEDFFLSQHMLSQCWSALLRLATVHNDIIVIVGAPVYYSGACYNCAVVLQNGRIVGVHPKKALAREGVHYEPRWFTPWSPGKMAVLDSPSTQQEKSIPFGDFYYRIKFADGSEIGMAIEICEEAWLSNPTVASYHDKIDLVVNPSASHFSIGKQTTREHLIANLSRSYQVCYVYSNLLGLEAGRLIYDGSSCIAVGGSIEKRAPRFSYHEATLLHHDISIEQIRNKKLQNRSYISSEPSAIIPPLHAEHLRVEDAGVTASSFNKSGSPDALKSAAMIKVLCADAAVGNIGAFEEFLRAEALALFDYLRKSQARGFVLPLSGGCDSATVAVLIRQMIALACAEIGIDEVKHRILLGSNAASADQLCQQLLTCLYLASKNSGQQTHQAAKELAHELGARYFDFSIEPMVEAYQQQFIAHSALTLDWDHDDIALQNLQARSRAPLAWLLANKLNALLITTSNRSEAAVGYATMDGDMAGSIAPLAGISKTFLRKFLRWQQTECGIGVGKISSLKAINDLPPTAELRPPERSQTDESDLMPYEVLDAIEAQTVGVKLAPEQILRNLQMQFPAIKPQQLKMYFDKFQHLWRVNQWKRERIAPSFHVDQISQDPKYWGRFPILRADLGSGPLWPDPINKAESSD